MTDDYLDELLRDDYRGDPVIHETRWGEGWTRDTWRGYFISLEFGDEK